MRGLLRAASFSRLHKSKLQRRPRFRRIRVPCIDVTACNLVHLRRQFRRCGRLRAVQKAVEGRVHQRLGTLLFAVYHVPVHAEGVHVNAVPDEVFYPGLILSLFCLTSIETRPVDAFLLGKSLARSGFF